MRQFKLVADFPTNQLDLQTIVKQDTYGQYVTNDCTIFHKEEVENYPQFWQEIKKQSSSTEKDYEILDIIHKKFRSVVSYENGGGVYPKDFLSNTYRNKEHFVDCFVNKNSDIWEINSVKRIKDGEVFTRGNLTNKGIIEKLDNINGIFCVRIKTDRGVLTTYLNKIEHVRKPIFQTLDGIDVFEGDEYYTVFTMNDKRYETWTVTDKPFIASGKSKHYIHKDIFYFAKKETAENYILMNKPCLSIEMLIRCEGNYRGDESFTNSRMIEDFKKLVR